MDKIVSITAVTGPSCTLAARIQQFHWFRCFVREAVRAQYLGLRLKMNILYKNYYVRFQVLTAVSMKYRVFWDILPCSQIDVDRRFRGASGLQHQGDDGGSMHL
jgi:hypothetical protein